MTIDSGGGKETDVKWRDRCCSSTVNHLSLSLCGLYVFPQFPWTAIHLSSSLPLPLRAHSSVHIDSGEWRASSINRSCITFDLNRQVKYATDKKTHTHIYIYYQTLIWQNTYWTSNIGKCCDSSALCKLCSSVEFNYCPVLLVEGERENSSAELSSLNTTNKDVFVSNGCVWLCVLCVLCVFVLLSSKSKLKLIICQCEHWAFTVREVHEHQQWAYR